MRPKRPSLVANEPNVWERHHENRRHRRGATAGSGHGQAEREERVKIINAEGESLAAAALGDASDTMTAQPLALQLRNLQSLVEIGVDKNATVVFSAPLMSTIAELGAFLAHESAAAGSAPTSTPLLPAPQPAGNGARPH